MTTAQKIRNCLWFVDNAEEAARFYTSIFSNSTIDSILRSQIDTPGTKAGLVLAVEITLSGQHFMLLNGGEHDKFNHSISLMIDCVDQAEVDSYWSALTAGGGQPVQCGWLKDKYGLSWQVLPRRLTELIADPDPTRAKRAMEAMMTMVKIDVAALEKAADGR
jgi:predicted 3-demethylubiquinone-9 3-methyltransferase (glyoxalase superfamily)